MLRKATSLFMLAAFILMSVSCTTVKTVDVRTAPPPGHRARIIRLVKASGESVVFSGVGRVDGRAITGKAVVSVQERVPAPVASVKVRADGSVYEIVDRDGRIHPVSGVLSKGENEWTILVPGGTVQSVSIPLSEVVLIEYRKTDAARTILAITPVVALALLIAGLLIYSNNI